MIDAANDANYYNKSEQLGNRAVYLVVFELEATKLTTTDWEKLRGQRAMGCMLRHTTTYTNGRTTTD